MTKEKTFIKPECEVIILYNEDIITESDPNFPGNIQEGHTDNTPLI